MDYSSFTKKLDTAESIIIYGAGVVAYGIYTALKDGYSVKIRCFAVTSMKGNRKIIDGIGVVEISEINIDNDRDIILVAVPEEYHDAICSNLKSLGHVNYICIDSKTEYMVMSDYFRNIEGFPLLEDACGETQPGPCPDMDLKVFMAKSHADRKLKADITWPYWIEPVQAGSSFTEERITKRQDNTGDNISEKNKEYGELTVGYWAWKNEPHDYMGLFHYRRILVLERLGFEALKRHEAEVIMPLPFVCYPDTSGQYLRYLRQEDIDIMLEALRIHFPDYYKAAHSILKNQYLYNYNIFIAVKEVVNDYYAWLFPLLDYISDLCRQTPTKRTDRYIGRIGEVLTALYFLYNKNGWKILHAEKRWLA